MNRLLPALLVLIALPWLPGCHRGTPADDPHGHHAEHGSEEEAKGPHGGRLLHAGNGGFALEVTIFERGTAPEFRLYPSVEGRAVPAETVQAAISLRRVNGLPGGRTDRHVLTAADGYLVSPGSIEEPHSFEVLVEAQHAGQRHEWRYDSAEGRTDIDGEMASAQGVATATAGPGTIREVLPLFGSIRPDAGRLRRVTARFPGVVKSVAVETGAAVRAGQTLATIESNESLQVYAVTAPIAGTVTRRAINPGETAGAEPLFEIADFSRVWAELSVFPRDRGTLHPGLPAQIAAADGGLQAQGRIALLSPAPTGAPSLTARVVLDNEQGQWTPGQFVNASVVLAEAPAALTVPLSALQTFRDWDVVFVVEGDRYQAQPVTLGRRDAERVEVTGGLEPGARIVVGNSYLVKADIEKSGASHDH